MKTLVKGLIASIGIAASAMSFATEVTLSHAVAEKGPMTPGGYCPFCPAIVGEVKVENIAYEKEVTLHYSVNGGAWSTTDAEFKTSIDNNKEVWVIRAGSGYISGGVADFEFAIEYEVAGQTYWDNNNGANYVLTAQGEYAGVEIDSKNVFADNFKVVYDSFRGDVFLKNLAYNKAVNIVYTYDNWETTLVGSASFDHTSTNPEFEVWSFDIDVPFGVEGIEFAVAYDVNGTTYWANNYGDNYFALPSSF